jgi:hypothetical protein
MAKSINRRQPVTSFSTGLYSLASAREIRAGRCRFGFESADEFTGNLVNGLKKVAGYATRMIEPCMRDNFVLLRVGFVWQQTWCPARWLFIAQAFAVILACSGTGFPLAAKAANARLHVLYIADTDDEKVGTGFAAGARLLNKVITEVKEGREAKFKLWELKGSDVNPNRILDAVRNLGVQRDDALLVAYFGHGGMDKQRNHYLATNRGDLYRDVLREEMDRTGAALQVLITDCCSSVAGVDPPNRRVPAEWAGFKQLFFESTGVVDFTAAADGTFGWANLDSGGFLTLALTRLLCKPVTEIDDNSDGRVSWEELFEKVQVDTNEIFQTAVNDPRNNGAEITSYADQCPRSFLLAPDAGEGIGYCQALADDYSRWFERHWSQISFANVRTREDGNRLLDSVGAFIPLLGRAETLHRQAQSLASQRGWKPYFVNDVCGDNIAAIQNRRNEVLRLLRIKAELVLVREQLEARNARR